MRRYLYSVYYKDELYKGCFDTLKEATEFIGVSMSTVYCVFSRKKTCDYITRYYSIYKIDSLEIHDDIFKEEDEIFKQEYYIPKEKERAKELGINLRTYQRKNAIIKRNML